MGMGSAIPNNTRLTNINLTSSVTSTWQFVNLFVTEVFYSFLNFSNHHELQGKLVRGLF